MTDAPGLALSVVAEIRAEMARQKMTGAELARRLGVSQSWISTRLNGQPAFNLRELERVAAVLGVPATRFLERAA